MANPFPDFGNTATFPTFGTLPEEPTPSVASSTSSPPSSSSSPPSQPPSVGGWCLLAQVKDDMTITKPTLVLHDREGSPFALVFEGLGRDDLDLKGRGLKKGNTVVFPGALRTPPAAEGKRGFVKVPPGQADRVVALPGSLERILKLGGGAGGRGGEASLCRACGKAEGEGGVVLNRCTGCARVRYCGKACQVKGWNEGHKADCKAYKAMNAIWG